MTTAQIINIIRRKLLEKTEEIFSNEDILLYVNIVKDKVAKRYLGNRLVTKSTISFVNGSATIPTNWNGHYLTKDSDVPGQGNEYKFVNQEDFQAGASNRMIAQDGSTLQIFPAESRNLYVWYYKKLPDMALTPTVINPPIEIDDIFHMVIAYGALSMTLEDAQDFELSKYFNDKYESEYLSNAKTVSMLEENTLESTSLFEALPNISDTGYYPPNYF